MSGAGRARDLSILESMGLRCVGILIGMTMACVLLDTPPNWWVFAGCFVGAVYLEWKDRSK